MASRHCIHYFEDEQLRTLQSALEDILATLKAHDPGRNWDADNELKTSIAAKLIALASIGIIKPEELRRRGLETLPMNSSKRQRRSNGSNHV